MCLIRCTKRNVLITSEQSACGLQFRVLVMENRSHLLSQVTASITADYVNTSLVMLCHQTNVKYGNILRIYLMGVLCVRLRQGTLFMLLDARCIQFHHQLVLIDML